MKAAVVMSAALSFLLGPTAHASGTVQWDIQKRHPTSSLARRAAGTYGAVIYNSIARGGYFATCTVGTPSQNLTLQLDTGSSDIWVPYTDAAICEADDCGLGTFNPNESSTYIDVGKGEFDISYVDGSHSKGDYFKDTFQIGGATISNMTMGLGEDTTIPYGLVGVGYALNEAIVGTENSLSAAYPNLPVVMVNEGLIPTIAYSLWLNDLDSSRGSILFGGIDINKYTGDLTKIDILKDNSTGNYSSFMVELTSMHATSSSGTDELTSAEFPIEVVLDSGTTLSYVPTDLAEQIWTEVGAIYTADTELALIPCKMQHSQGYFSFGFAGSNGPRINVTMDELVLDLVVDGPAPTFADGTYKGEEACEFGIQNSTGDPYLLGDTFLRSAYVVYDLVNNQIGIAPTDFNATESNVVAFESNGAAIPSATLAPSQSLATATASVTQPTFAAESGFSNVTSTSAARVTLSVGLEHLAVTGVVMLASLFGGALFIAL